MKLLLAEAPLMFIEKKRNKAHFNPAAIPGLFWVDPSAGKVKQSGLRTPINDMDRLPPPMRSNLVWGDDLNDALFQTMITYRGCPYLFRD